MSNKIERIVSFTVPHLNPPSVNHIYKPTVYTGKDGYRHRGLKVTPAVKAYKYAVALFARGATVAPPDAAKKKTTYDIRMTVVLGPRQHGDEDNFHKVGVDALVYAGVIHSDAYAHCVIDVVRDDRENPRTTYTVERIEE
jgi:hypothetical protein